MMACLQLVYFYITQPCLDTLMQTLLKTHQSTHTIFVILQVNIMDRYDVQLGPSTAFMKGMHIPAVGLRVTPLCIVGYVSEFPLFKISKKKRKRLYSAWYGAGEC